MHLGASLIALASAAGLVSAGINCNGAAGCPSVAGNLDQLINLANGIDDNRWYNSGQKIVCIQTNLGNTGLCAFQQNTGGAPGHSIKSLLRSLRDHGCKKCGSVPLFYPSDNNDSSHGILTVNVVGNTGGCAWGRMQVVNKVRLTRFK
ncbi:hypothetical protein FOXB_03083 [Fusarium oxysporum f. sp. conglutinans Fo5176]|uniref:Killer toxin Kp4 domain-containing protein n=1 Tax=Fusarium oxysporum (strain Fo5176) TaxID=660025 RepID=F9F9K8_FUSOF|nr:hypothetical protein FOXB_03083 [Fusarium oxysporum f. sp. conglutinans Fo5176]